MKDVDIFKAAVSMFEEKRFDEDILCETLIGLGMPEKKVVEAKRTAENQKAKWLEGMIRERRADGFEDEAIAEMEQIPEHMVRFVAEERYRSLDELIGYIKGANAAIVESIILLNEHGAPHKSIADGICIPIEMVKEVLS